MLAGDLDRLGLLGPVLLAICHLADAVLETRNPSAIAKYPSLSTSLMLTVKGSNRGKHVSHRRKLLWVEEGRGE